MKKLSKIIISAALLAVTAQSVFAAPVRMELTYDGKKHNYEAEEIELRVNGVKIELPLMPPVILDGRTYVPSREVFEPLGAGVDWKAQSKELYIGYNGTLIVMKADARSADVNGAIVPLESPAMIINDKLMIPARFVAEQLGIPVNWDPNSRTVSIGTEEIVVPETPAEPETSVPPAPSVPETPAVPASPSANIGTAGVSVDISTEPLSEISGTPIDVTSVNASGNVFTITASGAISKADKLILPENKLVIDIHNATNALQSASHPSNGFSGVAMVRNSQFQVTPTNITRIVFDLAGSNRFSVAFSPDRKSVIVTFEQNNVTGVEFKQSGAEETVVITGTAAPSVIPSRLFSPDRLIFDIPGSKYTGHPGDVSANGRFAGTVRPSQLDAGTTRITLDLKENAQYKITYTDTTAVITLSEPTYKNIVYTQQPVTSITLKGADALNAAQVYHRDDYLNKRYSLTLPWDYTGNFGYGTFEINDSIINNITIQNTNGKTEIIINQKNITAYVVENNGADLVIKPVNPKAIYKNVVYLDAGHGKADPGAQAGGFQEKNLNLNIMMRLYEILEGDPEIKVYASRLDDSYPENADRAYTANPIADLFISIHQNAATTGKSNGTEVLYLNHEGEVYPNISSEAVARIIQTNLSRDIDTTDRGVVKRPALIVLNQTTIPAVIVETVFMTNSSDLQKVSTQEGRQAVADSLYRSIKEIFRQYPTGR